MRIPKDKLKKDEVYYSSYITPSGCLNQYLFSGDLNNPPLLINMKLMGSKPFLNFSAFERDDLTFKTATEENRGWYLYCLKNGYLSFSNYNSLPKKETYNWKKIFKQGDSVKVLRKAKQNEKGWSLAWVEHMDQAIGKTFKVKNDTGTSEGVILSGSGGISDFYYPHFILEKVDKPKEKYPTTRFAKGDMVRITRKAENFEQGWKTFWVNRMDDYVGKTVEVLNDRGDMGVTIVGCVNYFPHFILEKITYDDGYYKKGKALFYYSENKAYGWDNDGKWFNTSKLSQVGINLSNSIKIGSEVFKDRIRKEAYNRGYHREHTGTRVDNWAFKPYSRELYTAMDGHGGVKVFNDGEWKCLTPKYKRIVGDLVLNSYYHMTDPRDTKICFLVRKGYTAYVSLNKKMVKKYFDYFEQEYIIREAYENEVEHFNECLMVGDYVDPPNDKICVVSGDSSRHLTIKPDVDKVVEHKFELHMPERKKGMLVGTNFKKLTFNTKKKDGPSTNKSQVKLKIKRFKTYGTKS